MKTIKISKKTNGNQLVVDVELPARRFANDPVHEFSNSELQDYLTREGIVLSQYEEPTASTTSLSSYSTKNGSPPKLTGTWIFEKKAPPVEKKVEKKVNKKITRASNKKTGE